MTIDANQSAGLMETQNSSQSVFYFDSNTETGSDTTKRLTSINCEGPSQKFQMPREEDEHPPIEVEDDDQEDNLRSILMERDD